MFRGLFSSFPIGSILGIPIRVHVLLVLMIVVIAFQSSVGTPALISLVALFPILLLHELGHCLVARRFGIGVVDITLWPLGGLARMTHIPESGRAEALIAVAGPAVNFVLAALLLPVSVVVSALEAGPAVEQVAWYLFFTNIALAVFNLIPAFPTDGGRILRAFFSMYVDWLSATRRAVIVGRVFAVLIGIAGLALGNWTAPLIAAWLWWMGSIELDQVRERHRSQARQEEVPLEAPASVEQILGHDAPDAAGSARVRRPLSDEDIERLERWRGRLRRYEN
jgi:stage IV sporulation protein FB